jgi:Protein of unknown function (DUF2934)
MSKKLVRKARRPQRPPAEQAADVPVETPVDQPPEGTPAFIEHDQRHAVIAQHAYFLAEGRGFEPGYELDDWLIAERDVEQASASHGGEEPTLCGE